MEDRSMSGRRWGFEDADEEDLGHSPGTATGQVDDAALTGSDPDGCATAVVGADGIVCEIRLAGDWRARVDPRGLAVPVQVAVNAAAAEAMSCRPMGEPTPERGSGPASGTEDEAPISIDEGQRLLDAAFADVEEFSRKLQAHAGRTVHRDSAGGHVSGQARHGQLVELTIDPRWASVARNSEIEGELREVVSRLQVDSSSGEFAGGPRSSAIDEVTALLSDPQLLLRRLGLVGGRQR
jgi:hypothetical protein